MSIAQIMFGEVTLIGGIPEGLPLPQSYLDENPNILNIDIGNNPLGIKSGWTYENGEFAPPIVYSEEPSDISVTTQSSIILNQDFVLSNQIKAQNRMLTIQASTLNIVPPELNLEEDGAISVLNIDTVSMYKNMYDSNYIASDTVFEAVGLEEITPSQYKIITAEDYIAPVVQYRVQNEEIESNQLIQMEAQVEVFDESNNNDLILMESIASIVESLDEIMLRLDRLEAK